MPVGVVDRNSDDFEPFDKILSQADTRTPPRVKGNKRKSIVPSPVYEDEDGEMSMDIASPISYFGSQRARVPESLIHAGPSARGSYFSPEVDFDEVPSPRASMATISASRRRSSLKMNGKSPGSGLGRSRLSQSHFSATPKKTAARKSLVASPGLPGDSDEELDDGFEPPPTFEYRSHNALPSPSPEQISFQELSKEEDYPPTAPEPDLVTSAGGSRQQGKDRSARRSKGDDKPLFMPDSDDERPETSTSKPTSQRKSINTGVAQFGFGGHEEEEVEENPPEDMAMDLDPPAEDFESRRSRKLSSIMEAPELEEEEEDEEDEAEPMEFEQDAGPEEPPESQPDEPTEERSEEPPPIDPPKKRGRKKKISFDENSMEAQRPPKKPRSNRTPLADKASDSRYVSIRPGKPRQLLQLLNLSSERTAFLFLLRIVSASPENPQGLRRGRRYRYAPLEWWRMEKVVYGADREEDRDNDEDDDDKPITLVPPIKAILRVPQDPIEPLGKKHKKRRGKSVTVDPESVPFPEAGWDKDTEAYGHVLDYTTQEEVRRRVAFTTRMAREVSAKKADYTYQKIFTEGHDLAAGHIQLEPGAEKPNKSSKDNSYVRSTLCVLYLISSLIPQG